MAKKPTSDMRIVIKPGGPMVVHGRIPLREGRIRPVGKGYVLDEGRELPQGVTYALCRCGESDNKPFCDHSCAACGFGGLDVAEHTTYEQRADVLKGTVMTIGDDHRCAFVRFCHNQGGDAWKQSRQATTDDEVASATAVVDGCLTGRLTRRENGEWVEPQLDPCVMIIQDPQQSSSSGVVVLGGIPLEGTAGPYETRQRCMLCRCGSSEEMPFCDAMHIAVSFDDGHVDG